MQRPGRGGANRDIADSLVSLLEALGHPARAAYDGVQADETVLDFQPDVAALDVRMPRMDSCVAAARRHRQHQGIGRPRPCLDSRLHARMSGLTTPRRLLVRAHYESATSRRLQEWTGPQAPVDYSRAARGLLFSVLVGALGFAYVERSLHGAVLGRRLVARFLVLGRALSAAVRRCPPWNADGLIATWEGSWKGGWSLSGQGARLAALRARPSVTGPACESGRQSRRQSWACRPSPRPGRARPSVRGPAPWVQWRRRSLLARGRGPRG